MTKICINTLEFRLFTIVQYIPSLFGFTFQFILVFNWIEYKPATYGLYVYPTWADAVGWTIGVLPVVVVVLMAVNQICSGPDDLTIMEVCIVLWF